MANLNTTNVILTPTDLTTSAASNPTRDFGSNAQTPRSPRRHPVRRRSKATSLHLEVNAMLRAMYHQLGLLMCSLINNPRDVVYVRNVSNAVLHSMALFLTRWTELGRQVIWVQSRVSHVRDILETADAHLQAKVSFDAYLAHSRTYMDLCTRGGAYPCKPPRT